MTNLTQYFPAHFQLRKGAGGGDPRNGLCYMETVALIAGKLISDHPDCACPVLTAYGIRLNDCLSDAERQRLLPLAWATAGTRSGEHEVTRLRILGRAACDIAEMVLPLFEAQHPTDRRPHLAIETARAYWDAKLDAYTANAAAAYTAAAAAAAAAYTAAYAAAAANTADAAADATVATANSALYGHIVNRAIAALREAIEAGPHGGLLDETVRQRIDAVRELLPVGGV